MPYILCLCVACVIFVSVPLLLFQRFYSLDSVVIQVQNLIERCLQLYMSQKEVVSTLLHQAKIEPSFTELGKTHIILYFAQVFTFAKVTDM